jgi:hypothetical protein
MDYSVLPAATLHANSWMAGEKSGSLDCVWPVLRIVLTPLGMTTSVAAAKKGPGKGFCWRQHAEK